VLSSRLRGDTLRHSPTNPSPPRRYITNMGVERFKITKVVKERPVLVCEVEVLPEDEDESAEVRNVWCGASRARAVHARA
jgi:Lon protease-like protein